MEQQNFRNGNNTLWMALLIMALFFICCSCGARKVDKTELKESAKITEQTTATQKEEVKKESETNIKETTTTTIDEAKNIVTEVTEIVPIDPTKEATFTDSKGQKHNLNNSKYRNEKTNDLSNKKSTESKEYLEVKKDLETAVRIAEQQAKTIAELQKKLDIKNSERKSSYWWLLWLLLLIPGYLYYRKYGFRLP